MNGSDVEHPADIVARLLVRVYEIHATVLEKGGGGIEGLRDADMLHAAVTRPFSTFAGIDLYPSDFEKAAALYLLHEQGWIPKRPLPKDEVIRVCVELAEEAQRRGAGDNRPVKTIAEIADWLKELVERPD